MPDCSVTRSPQISMPVEVKRIQRGRRKTVLGSEIFPSVVREPHQSTVGYGPC